MARLSRSFFAVCLFFLGWATLQGAAPVRETWKPAPPPAEPLRVTLHPYVLDLKTLQVNLGGQARRFLLDTGGGVSTLTRELAQSLGERPWGRLVGYRMSGEPVRMQRTGPLEASLEGGIPLSLPQAAVFDLTSLLPKGLPPIDGVLSLDAFRGQVLTLDYGRNEMILHSPASAAAALAAHGCSARMATGEDGSGLTLLLPVSSVRGPLWFLLDSGDADGTFVSEQVAEEKLVSLKGQHVTLEAGGRPGVQLGVAVRRIHYDGVLGTDFLLKGPVTLDLRNAPLPGMP